MINEMSPFDKLRINFLDFLFPKRCVQCGKVGSFLCSNCFSYLSFDTPTFCLICRRPSVDSLIHPGCLRKYSIDGYFSAIPYNKTAQKLIYNFKYKPYLSSLAEFLGDILYESLIQNEVFQRVLKNQEIKKWILVPTPLHSSKLRTRGYNQSEILAKELGKRFNFTILNLLNRVKDTKTQVGLKVKERRKNVKDAFKFNYELIAHNLELKDTGVFLLDDVVTTGSTLLEAAKVLKRRGFSKVFGITLARD